jgi:hypothetical protein
LQSALGHLRLAKKLAENMEFAQATRELDQVQLILERGPNQTSGKSRPFTVKVVT